MARKPLDSLSPAYRKRIERAEAEGFTRQAARGHKAREHVYRREREKRELGITRAENDVIRKWYRRSFNPNGQKGKPSEDRLIDYAVEHGYAMFRWRRTQWEAERRAYVKRGYKTKSEAAKVVTPKEFARGGGGGGNARDDGYGGEGYGGSGEDYYEDDFGDLDDDADIWAFYH